MNDISILSVNIDSAKLKPLREKLGNHLCKCYSIRPFHKPKEDNNGLYLTVLPDIASVLCSKLANWGVLPNYWTYWIRVKMLDFLVSRKIGKDSSKILYTSSFYNRSIRRAKECGKIVVILAGNSEATREYERVTNDYNTFSSRHRYIYGDKRFRNSRLKGFDEADHVIAISKVSLDTYAKAGYNIDKFKLIPLTGTDFERQPINANVDKPKAFITTAFHNFVKGTHRLLLAWQKAQIKDIPLIVVGRLCEDMQEFIERYGPFHNVLFMGYVKGSLQEFYAQYDAVGVLLSLSEGAVRTTPELMSFGFPMIVSPDATCDLVEDGVNGFVVETTDEDAIVEKLCYFADDWNRACALRSNVLESVKTRTVRDFSLEVADYLLSLIENEER